MDSNLKMSFYRYKFVYNKNKNESEMVLDYEGISCSLDTIANTLLDFVVNGVENVDENNFNENDFKLDKYYSSQELSLKKVCSYKIDENIKNEYDFIVWQYYKSDGIIYKNVFSFDYVDNIECEDQIDEIPLF